jgi:beta-phosphoglucomutase-like phosphatase (HAD superfamily)
MKPDQKLKGLIFDFNGVLFWDDQLQRDSWRAFAAKLRKQPLSDAEIDIHVHGRNGKYTLEYLLGYPIGTEESADFIEQKESIYRQMCLNLNGDFRLSPGAILLLDDLVKHKIPHNIATASGKKNVDFFIQHLNLGSWFETEKIMFDNGQILGKPAPDLYLGAAEKLDLSPVDCMVIEDSHSGIQAARAAGIGWVVALGPERTHPKLAKLSGVDQAIESLREIVCQDFFEVTGG